MGANGVPDNRTVEQLAWISETSSVTVVLSAKMRNVVFWELDVMTV